MCSVNAYKKGKYSYFRNEIHVSVYLYHINNKNLIFNETFITTGLMIKDVLMKKSEIYYQEV